MWTCSSIEERISEYVEERLSGADRLAVDAHLDGCARCRELEAGVRDVIAWGQAFPFYPAPEWLAPRILANTPQRERETWLDTVVAIWRWIAEPRLALGVLTTVLVVAWMANLTGISPSPDTLTNPTRVYYRAESLAGELYDQTVRLYYRVPQAVVSEIQSRLVSMQEPAG